MCRHLDSAIVKARSAFPYTGWVSSAIRSFKYADEYDRSGDLAGRMMPSLTDLGPIDLIIPVPLFPAKLDLRGYNQSTLLAGYLAQALGVRMYEGLVRTRNTIPQVQLGRDDRHANVHDAFAVSSQWAPHQGLRLLLVDDVRTTGATLSACARVLQQVQPSSICVATLAVDVPARQLNTWLDAIGRPSSAP
jgi:ComF family protein